MFYLCNHSVVWPPQEGFFLQTKLLCGARIISALQKNGCLKFLRGL